MLSPTDGDGDPRRTRRGYLATLGTAAVAALAGCSSSGGSDNDSASEQSSGVNDDQDQLENSSANCPTSPFEWERMDIPAPPTAGEQTSPATCELPPSLSEVRDLRGNIKVTLDTDWLAVGANTGSESKQSAVSELTSAGYTVVTGEYDVPSGATVIAADQSDRDAGQVRVYFSTDGGHLFVSGDHRVPGSCVRTASVIQRRAIETARPT